MRCLAKTWTVLRDAEGEATERADLRCVLDRKHDGPHECPTDDGYWLKWEFADDKR